MTNETVQTPVVPTLPGALGPAIIHTRNLTKQFGEEVAVRDVTFDVPPGQIFGFIGPSGSGKTTTIRLLTGYYAPTSGEVAVFGRPPTKFKQDTRERVGYMPQLFVLYPHLSVWENLNFVASIYGMSPFRGKRLNAILDFVEMKKDKRKLAREISGGMQRRLSLAATLIHDPELIFLDEPTAGIDPVLRQKFWDHFRELRQAGRTLFVTTQYVSEANYCDLVGVMTEGALLTVDTPAGLRHQAYGGEILDLQASEPLDYQTEYRLRDLPFVKKGQVRRTGPNSLRLTVDEASTAIPALLEWCRDNNIPVESVEEFTPPFDDVFVELVQKESSHA